VYKDSALKHKILVVGRGILTVNPLPMPHRIKHNNLAFVAFGSIEFYGSKIRAVALNIGMRFQGLFLSSTDLARADQHQS